MILTEKNSWTYAIESWANRHKVSRFFISHTALAFFYGIFLMAYEIQFVDILIRVVHPFLIAWAGLLFLYDVCVRRIWFRLPYWKFLFVFAALTVLTALLNINTGIVQNLKALIMTMLPLVAFYPLCVLSSKEQRRKTLLIAMLGAAVVAFCASLFSIGLFMERFGADISFMGVTRRVGIRLYDPRYANSGIILYGVYRDTNHPATYAVVFSLYSLVLFLSCQKKIFSYKWANALGQIFAAANFAVQVCYFPLANSRGGWLSLAVSVLLTAFLYLFFMRLYEKKALYRAGVSLLLAVACTLGTCGGLLAVRSVLSHASISIVQMKNHQQQQQGQQQQEQRPSSTVPEKKPVQTVPPAEASTDSFEKPNEHFGAERLQIWRETLRLFTKRPIFGENPGNSKYYAQQYLGVGHMANGSAVHNSYLDLLLDYGVAGFLVLIAFFVLCAWAALKRIWRKDIQLQNPVTYFLLLCGVFMIAASAFLLSCVFINTSVMYFLLMVIVGYILSECEAAASES